MLIALLCAAVHGAALPIMCIVFGQMTDSFVQSGQTFNLTGIQVTYYNLIGNVVQRSMSALIYMYMFTDV